MAIDDKLRLCEFIEQNLMVISKIIPRLDTHTAIQFYYPIFRVNKLGKSPSSMTMISLEDIEN